MKATNILWDVDDVESIVDLPTEVEIPNDMIDSEEISEYLTNYVGYCHYGFCISC